MPWDYDGTDTIMPEGEYKVRLDDAVEKQSKAGGEYMEFKLTVFGKGVIYYRLNHDYKNKDNTNRRYKAIYTSFDIPEGVTDFYEYRGTFGVCMIKHRMNDYYGMMEPYVCYFIPRDKRPELFKDDEKFKSAYEEGTLDLREDTDMPDFDAADDGVEMPMA